MLIVTESSVFGGWNSYKQLHTVKHHFKYLNDVLDFDFFVKGLFNFNFQQGKVGKIGQTTPL